MASESILGDVTIPALFLTLLALCATVVALLRPKRWPATSKDEGSKPLSEDELIRELEGSTRPKAKQKRTAKPKAGRAEPLIGALQAAKAHDPPKPSSKKVSAAKVAKEVAAAAPPQDEKARPETPPVAAEQALASKPSETVVQKPDVPPRSGLKKTSKAKASPAANVAEEVTADAPPQDEKARPEPPPAAAEQAVASNPSESMVPKSAVPQKAGSKKTKKAKEVTAEAPPQEETPRPQPPPAAAEQAPAARPAGPAVPAHADPKVTAELNAANGKTRSKGARAPNGPCAASPEETNAAAEDVAKPAMPSDAPAVPLANDAAGNEQQAEAGCATGTVRAASAEASEATCHLGEEAKEEGSQPRAASATGAPVRTSKGQPVPGTDPSPPPSKSGAQRPQGVPREIPRTALEKEILKWGKKSREVQELRRRLDEGDDLDPHQRDKVARGQDIADRLAALQVEREKEIEEAAAEQKRAAEPAPVKEEPAAEAAEVEPAQPATGKEEPAAEAAARAARATCHEGEVQQLNTTPKPKTGAKKEAEVAPAKVERPAEVALEATLSKAQEGKVWQPDVTPKQNAGTTKKASKANAKAWATLPKTLESALQELPAEEPLQDGVAPPDLLKPPAAAAPSPQDPAALAPTPAEPATPKTTAVPEDVTAAEPLQEGVTLPGVSDPPSAPASELPESAVPKTSAAPEDVTAAEPLQEGGTPPGVPDPPSALAPELPEPAVPKTTAAPEDVTAAEPLQEGDTLPGVSDPPSAPAPELPEPALPKTTAVPEDVTAAEPLQEGDTLPGVPDPPSAPAPELPEPAVPTLPTELAAPVLPEKPAMPAPEPLEPAAPKMTAALEAVHDEEPAGDDPSAGPETAAAAEDDAAPAAGSSDAPAPTPAAEGEGCPAGAVEPDAAEALCHEGDDATGEAAAPEVVGRPPERDKGRTRPEESCAEAEAADTTDAVDDDFTYVSSAKVRGQKPKPRALSSERQSRATEAPTTSRQRAAPVQPGARPAHSPGRSPGKRVKPGSWVIGMGPPPPNRPKPGAKAGEPQVPPPDLVVRTACEKEILKLEKKVKEIQSLQQRLDGGGDLDAAQREKVARGPEILETLDAMRQRRLMEIEGEAEARAARAERAGASPHPQAASPSPHGMQANAASFFPSAGVAPFAAAGILQQGVAMASAAPAGQGCMPMGLPMQSPTRRLKPLDYADEDSVRLACPQPYHPGLQAEAEHSLHSAALMQMGAMGQMGQFGLPSPMEGRWDACWEWVQHGWCPRGLTCRWDHPMMGPVAYSAPVVPTQYWAPGEEGLQYPEDYPDAGSYIHTCQPVGVMQQQAEAGGD